jgi:hypothetical protein
MDENRRFGMSGKARFRLYLFLGLLAFVAVIVSGEHREIAVALFVCLLVWGALFDPVGRDGNRTILGYSADQARKFGIGSLFGRKIDD